MTGVASVTAFLSQIKNDFPQITQTIIDKRYLPETFRQNEVSQHATDERSSHKQVSQTVTDKISRKKALFPDVTYALTVIVFIRR